MSVQYHAALQFKPAADSMMCVQTTSTLRDQAAKTTSAASQAVWVLTVVGHHRAHDDVQKSATASPQAALCILHSVKGGPTGLGTTFGTHPAGLSHASMQRLCFIRKLNNTFGTCTFAVLAQQQIMPSCSAVIMNLSFTEKKQLQQSAQETVRYSVQDPMRSSASKGALCTPLSKINYTHQPQNGHHGL